MGGGITDVERGVSRAPAVIDSYQARDVLTQRMERIVRMEHQGNIRSEVRDTLRNAQDRRRAGRQSLESGRYFRDEDHRLLFLRFVLEDELDEGFGNAFQYRGPRDPDRIVAAMVEYEIARMKSQAAEAVPMPPPAPNLRQVSQPMNGRGVFDNWEQRAAENDRSEYAAYLFEIARLDEQEKQESRRGMVYSGAATVSLYESYIGSPIKATAAQAIEAVPHLVSLALDFVPIVGQLKAVAEAITGRDLITMRKLADWERGLNALIAFIPSARGVFRAGHTGLRTLAAAARTARASGQSAEEIYRVTKVASTLSEAEVRAGKQLLLTGKPANPSAFEKLAGSLDEMAGVGLPGRRAQSYRVASGVIEDGRGLSRSVASSPIDAARTPPGRVVPRAATAPAVARQLSGAGIRPEAVAALEQAGVKITPRLARTLATTKAKDFVNNFHQCTGFELVVKDLGGAATKRKGALLVIEFVTDAANRIDPKLARFELPVGITKRPTRESAARFTDLVVSQGGRTLNYEFKAYSQVALARSLGSPKKVAQLVKDVVMLKRQNIRWVFDSREVSRADVYAKFTQAIQSDAVLAKEFGDPAKLQKALDELIILYPPVP